MSVFDNLFGEGILRALPRLVSGAKLHSVNRASLRAAAEGRQEEALALAEEAYALARGLFGPAHREVAVCAHNLVLGHDEVGRPDRAAEVMEAYVESLRAVSGADAPETLLALNQLGMLYMRAGHHADAEMVLLGMRDMVARVHGEQSREYAATLCNLAATYDSAGRAADAVPLLEQAVAIHRALEDPELVVTLGNLAKVYRGTARFDDAQALHPELLEQVWLRCAGDPGRLAEVLVGIGTTAYETGDFRFARETLSRALHLRREHFGPRSLEVAEVHNNLGTLFATVARYAVAVRHLRAAVRIERKLLPPEHPKLATSLNNLAAVYRSMGRYAEARSYFIRALKMRRRTLGEDSLDTAISLNNLGTLFRDMGETARALPLFRRAMRVVSAVRGPDHPDIAQLQLNMGQTLVDMGKLGRGERHLRRALEIRRAAFGPVHPAVAESLNGLATARYAAGDYRQAIDLMQVASDTMREALGDRHPSYAVSLANQAEFLRVIGDHERAAQLLGEVADIQAATLSPGHPDRGRTLLGLGNLHLSALDPAGAIPPLRAALRIFRAPGRAPGAELPRTLSGLGLAYGNLGRLRRSEVLIRRALQTSRTTLGEHHSATAVCRHNLASIHMAHGDRESAAREYREVLAARRAGAPLPDSHYVQALLSLAVCLHAAGEERASLRQAWKALAIQTRLLGQVFSLASEAQRLSYVETLRMNRDAVLSTIVHSSLPERLKARAALALVLRRKGLTLEALAAQRRGAQDAADPDLRPLLDELNVLRARIAQQTLAGPGRDTEDAAEALLRDWTLRRERLEARIARKVLRTDVSTTLTGALHRRVAAALPLGSVLVEVVRYLDFDPAAIPARGEVRLHPPRYLAVVLPAGAPERASLVDLGEADALDALVRRFRLASSGGRALAHRRMRRRAGSRPARLRQLLLSVGPRLRAGTAEETGERLHAALLSPLLPALPGCERVIFAPDGDLAQLPLGALPLGDGRHAIDAWRIEYLACGRDILRLQWLRGEAGPPLVAADPDYDLRVAGAASTRLPDAVPEPLRTRSGLRISFPPLPGTRTEGECIAERLGVELLRGAEVLERRVKSARSPRILHLATHGFFLDAHVAGPPPASAALGFALPAGGIDRLAYVANPLLRSGIALAGANAWLDGDVLPEEAEDGVLNAEDVSVLDLSGTEMVVLSACDTGLGDIHPGEGVLGLRRAFALAGARTLVMSLWKVPDAATARLMVAFYDALAGGLGRSEALRRAQLAVRARHPHPRYWGAFICEGEAGPLALGDIPYPAPVSGKAV